MPFVLSLLVVAACILVCESVCPTTVPSVDCSGQGVCIQNACYCNVTYIGVACNAAITPLSGPISLSVLSAFGGSLQLVEGDGIAIPPNAFNANLTISLASYARSSFPLSLSTQLAAGTVKIFSPESLTFTSPVTVTVRYDPGYTIAEASTSSTTSSATSSTTSSTGLSVATGLSLYKYNPLSADWEAVSNTQVNLAQLTISASVLALGRYVVVYDTSGASALSQITSGTVTATSGITNGQIGGIVVGCVAFVILVLVVVGILGLQQVRKSRGYQQQREAQQVMQLQGVRQAMWADSTTPVASVYGDSNEEVSMWSTQAPIPQRFATPPRDSPVVTYFTPSPGAVVRTPVRSSPTFDEDNDRGERMVVYRVASPVVAAPEEYYPPPPPLTSNFVISQPRYASNGNEYVGYSPRFSPRSSSPFSGGYDAAAC